MQAEARDFNRLANAIDVLGRYQRLVGGVRKAWAEQNRDTVIGYIQAFSEAVDWLYDASNKEEKWPRKSEQRHKWKLRA